MSSIDYNKRNTPPTPAPGSTSSPSRISLTKRGESVNLQKDASGDIRVNLNWNQLAAGGDRKRGFFGNRSTLVTHNDYLSVLIEMGLPAFLVFAFLFFHTLRTALFERGPLRSIAVPLFLGNAIYSLTHNSSNSVTFFYFLFLPLAFSGLKLPALARRRAIGWRARWRPASEPAQAEG